MRKAIFGLAFLSLASSVDAACVYKQAMTDAEIKECREAEAEPPPKQRAPYAPKTTWTEADEAAFKEKQRAELERQRDKDRQREAARNAPYMPTIGMTEAEAKMTKLVSTFCNPPTVNRTTTARGVREQWVCVNSYIYLENGIVTAVQDNH